MYTSNADEARGTNHAHSEIFIFSEICIVTDDRLRNRLSSASVIFALQSSASVSRLGSLCDPSSFPSAYSYYICAAICLRTLLVRESLLQTSCQQASDDVQIGGMRQSSFLMFRENVTMPTTSY